MNRPFVLLLILVALLSLAQTGSAELVAHYKLDDGAGTTAVDSSGNHFDGTISGDPTWEAGYMGGALSFNGADAVALPAADMGLTAAEGAVAFWMFAGPPAGIGTMFWAGDNTTGGGFGAENETHIHLEAPGTYWAGGECSFWTNSSFLFTDPAKGTVAGTAPVNPLVLGDQQWHHVAASWSASNAIAELYIDGELIVSSSYSSTYEFTTIYLGRMANNSRTYNGLLDDVQIYNTPLTPAQVGLAMAGGIAPGPATGPVPADGADDVLRDIVLGWVPGPYAVTHDIYLGTSFDDVNTASRTSPLDVLASENQSAGTYQPDMPLEYGQTYYWRIDEVNKPSDNVIYTGNVWSFTTEPYSYLVPDVSATASIPAKAGSEVVHLVDGSGLTPDGGHSTDGEDMWQGTASDGDVVSVEFSLGKLYLLHQMLVWNYNHDFEQFLNFSLKDVTIEYSLDGIEWTVLGDHVLNQGTHTVTEPGQAIDLQGVAAQYVRLTANSNYGGSGYGLSEVQFYFIPTFSRHPDPADGAEGVDFTSQLTWRPGREAAMFRVYLGTDENAVADGSALVGTAQTNAYSPSMLDLGTQYFWRIDDVNNAQTPSTWESDVWSFSTLRYLVIDDFESYTDKQGEEIFATWPDGYGIPSNGAEVTYENPPYAESDIVHDGKQSMPYHYGKNGATNSEATMTVGGQNWTRGNATTLVLYFRGEPDNAPAQLYVKINGTRINYPGDAADLAEPTWMPWNVDLTALGATATNVTSMTIGVTGPGAGRIYIDDIRLYREPVSTAD